MRTGWTGNVWMAGLFAALGCSGCAAGADLGARAAVGLLGALLTPSSGDGSSEPAAVSTTTAPSGETPCRKKQREWREANGNPRTEAPIHLRCGPAGEWPDEDEVRAASRPGPL